MNFLHATSLLVAQADAPAGRVVYEFSRLEAFDDKRLPLALLALCVAAIAALAIYLYRRDTVELPRSVGVSLAVLRCIALAGLLVFFLGLERRTNREVVHHSQVAVLVDVSQSMGITDADGNRSGESRLDAVAGALEHTPLVDELRSVHDVNVARFDREVQPVVSLPKDDAEGSARESEPLGKASRASPGVRLVADDAEPAASRVDWSALLVPRGTETRLGDALDAQLRLYRGAPLAGVVVISDGAQNAGIEPSAAIEAAKLAKVPIFTIGVGSTEPRRNVAVSDLLVPARAFPGDSINISGFVQATGCRGRFVDVELRRRAPDEPMGAGQVVASQRVQLGADGDVVPVSFDIEPALPGRFVYQLRVVVPDDDDNPRDNGREAQLDVVDRKTRVLLIAGGPSREYRFLRNQLHRDKMMEVDVLLQSAGPGISQDARRILAEFPTRREELFEYDAIVAFDPDWTQLDATQVDLLEKWVSDEAGGMIVVPGPIYTSRWVRSTEHAKLRDLYPVVFQRRLTLLDDGQFGSEEPWPIEFERAGRDARFLWLADKADESELAWAGFPGVYGYYGVKGEKPGATVYARVADPQSRLSDQAPIYLAGQFYGSGQVFYIGSGEFWRLRALDPTYFEVLYTKLVRQVSQGRLLRGSARGSLLVDRDRYELGETVVLRARLSDAQHQPLTVESVSAQVVRPDGSTEPVKLRADGERPGMYLGQFAVHQEGTYHVALPVPGSDEDPFTRFLQVRVPDLERAHPERNEALLAALAAETGGRYFPRLDLAAHGDDELPPLATLIPNRAEVKVLKGAPDRDFARAQMHWLLAIIAGALFLEWIVRRLNRLA